MVTSQFFVGGESPRLQIHCNWFLFPKYVTNIKKKCSIFCAGFPEILQGNSPTILFIWLFILSLHRRDLTQSSCCTLHVRAGTSPIQCCCRMSLTTLYLSKKLDNTLPVYTLIRDSSAAQLLDSYFSDQLLKCN